MKAIANALIQHTFAIVVTKYDDKMKSNSNTSGQLDKSEKNYKEKCCVMVRRAGGPHVDVIIEI